MKASTISAKAPRRFHASLDSLNPTAQASMDSMIQNTKRRAEAIRSSGRLHGCAGPAGGFEDGEVMAWWAFGPSAKSVLTTVAEWRACPVGRGEARLAA